MNGSWIITRSGKKFDLFDPKPDQIKISDIAYSLSQICRFNGHTKGFYSVAQHCYLCSYQVITQPGYKEPSQRYLLELEALLHDAPEAFLGDWSRPLKQSTQLREQLASVQRIVDLAIRRRFGLPEQISKEVIAADNILLATEIRDLVSASIGKYDDVARVTPLTRPIKPCGSERAEAQFLRRYVELMESINGW